MIMSSIVGNGHVGAGIMGTGVVGAGTGLLLVVSEGSNVMSCDS
jgi:hypothetical protein